jgi:hypothetical protein
MGRIRGAEKGEGYYAKRPEGWILPKKVIYS